MVMLTADGTRDSVAPRPRTSPASSAARKMCTLSLVNAMGVDLSKFLKEPDFIYQANSI
jgi:hypothetical protein